MGGRGDHCLDGDVGEGVVDGVPHAVRVARAIAGAGWKKERFYYFSLLGYMILTELHDRSLYECTVLCGLGYTLHRTAPNQIIVLQLFGESAEVSNGLVTYTTRNKMEKRQNTKYANLQRTNHVKI